MNRITNFFFLVTFLTGISLFGQTAYDFLRMDTSPRAAALAGSYVADNDDPNAIFYNPATIYGLEGTPVSFSFFKHLMDINAASISAVHNFEGIGKFGAGIQYFDYGTFTKADEYGNRDGEFGAADLALIVGYSNQLDENFNYGANIKLIYSSIEEHSSSAVAFDLGLNYVIPESRWSFGFSALNIGTQLSSYLDTEEDLPLDVRAGFTKELEHMPFKFYFSFIGLNDDVDTFFDRFKQFTFGGEIRLSKVIKVRLGYDNEKRNDLKIENSSGLAGFNAGLGFKVSDYFIDYSFSSLGSIGSLHRVGISSTF